MNLSSQLKKIKIIENSLKYLQTLSQITKILLVTVQFMGSSLTMSPSPISRKQNLFREYSFFTVPPQFQTYSSPSPSSSHHINHCVYGKKYLKAIHNISHFTNKIESQKLIDEYFLRHQSRDIEVFPIVKVLGVKQVQQNNVCSSYSFFCVITQDLTLLNQIQNMFLFEQCIYLLFECLMGFYYLYLKNGSFNVTEKMVGINKQGKVKVWMNENFALNRLQDCGFEVYLNRNLSNQGQQRDKLNRRIVQNKMIKQILSIIDVKYQKLGQSFTQILQANIKKNMREVSIQDMNFEQLLKTICQYEQNSGSSLFIPNKIRIQKGVESKLAQRQSLSIKLQKAINEYRQQKQQLQLKSSISQSSKKVYSTGVNGNTLKKYVPKDSEITSQSNFNKPEVKFHYQDFGMHSGLVQSGYFLTDNNHHHLNFYQFNKDYSVRDAQSEIIGIRNSEFVERLDDFNNFASRNQFVNQSYTQGEYEQEIQSLSKDMRDTYFRSTGGSRVENPCISKSRSYGDAKSTDQNMSRSNSQLQLISSKLVEELTAVRQPTVSLGVNWKNQSSSYKQKNILPYLSEDSTNNFMRITQQLQQQSYRPSLMSIKVDGRSSFDKRSQQIKGIYQNNEMRKESTDLMEQNIISPIIQSRFTENFRFSSEYIERPFSLAYSNIPKTSLDPQEKQNLQTGTSFY